MGMPVKLSDELVMAARDEAQAADRSITGQIEHWAKLGKAVERVLGGSVIRLLKDFPAHDPAPVSTEALRSRVLSALNQLTVDPDREAALRLIAAESRAAYEADPDRPGRVVQVSPDGSRTPGRFRGRTFVPANTTDESEAARKRLSAIRKSSSVGDVVSPILEWEGALQREGDLGRLGGSRKSARRMKPE